MSGDSDLEAIRAQIRMQCAEYQVSYLSKPDLATLKTIRAILKDLVRDGTQNGNVSWAMDDARRAGEELDALLDRLASKSQRVMA